MIFAKRQLAIANAIIAAFWLGIDAKAALADPEATMPEVRLDAELVSGLGAEAPRRVQGTLRIKNWGPEGGRCLYLPYEDADYGEDRGTNRRFEMFSGTTAKVVFEGGSLGVVASAPVKTGLTKTPSIVRLQVPSGWSAADEIVLRFDAQVPRLPSSDEEHWFYDGFLPQLQGSCQPEGLDPAYYRTSLTAHVVGKVRVPTGWEYVGPGAIDVEGSVDVDIKARTYAFALGKHYLHRKFNVADTQVDVAYHSAGFDEIADTVARTVPIFSSMFGPYPYKSLAIVETTEVQRHGLPGIIAINRPAQAAFSHVQRDWLNWQHWIVALQIARQWFGGAIIAPTPDDDWLVTGMVEFATLEALSHHPTRFNLFNADSGGFRLLSFDYLQISEISAATLRRFAPFATLTDASFVTRDQAQQQHPFLFSKQAFALRQLKSFAGEPAFFGFLRSLTAHYLNGTLSPKEFHTFLSRLPSPFSPQLRRDLGTFLARWWTSEGWPDFALDDLRTESLPEGRWLSQVAVSQEGAVDFPPMVGVEDESHRVHYTRAEAGKTPDAAHWLANIVTPYKPMKAVVDPGHEAFDSNRFNNSSSGAGLQFFPGSAETLRDDAYTVVWLPYAFRRPGEPFSIGLQGALFRYIQGGAYAKVEVAPADKLGSVQIKQNFQYPSVAMSSEFLFDQNYDNDRLAEVAVQRSPLFAGNPQISLAVKGRHRERTGEPLSSHETVALSTSMKPRGRSRYCGYSLSAEIEHAPEALAHGFWYERKLGVVAGDCNLTARTNLAIRVFSGALYGQGEVPDAVLFKPTDLQEARLRMDQRGLARDKKLTVVGTDLMLPFYIPLPGDTMILARQMRWRLFYDYGRAYDERIDYRSAGWGFLLPFGGDLAGAGSLALTRLTVLAIAYTKVDGEVSRHPSIVFDVTGEL